MKIINEKIMELRSHKNMSVTDYDWHIKDESQKKSLKEIKEDDFEDSYKWNFKYWETDLANFNSSDYLLVAGEKISFNDPKSWLDLKVIPFTTKSGRRAFRLEKGGSCILKITDGSGDKSWGGYTRDLNAIISFAYPTSNGGGCWCEISLKESGISFLSKEEVDYTEDIDV